MSLPVSTKRPSLLSYPVGLGLLAMSILGLAGCGGSEPEPSAPVAAAPATAEEARDDSQSQSADAGGQAYGGGSYGGGASGGAEAGGGADDAGGVHMMDDGGGADMSAEMMSADSTMSDAGGAADMAGGMDYGGNMLNNAAPQFAAALEFVRTNCVNCHGPRDTKGDTRLDVLTDDLAHTGNAIAWHAVLTQLESGQMPPASVQRRPDAKQKAAAQAWIKSALIKADFVPLQERDYLSQAEYAFSMGKEAKAVNLLYAQAIAADEDVAAETLSQTRWSTLGLHPALVLRFAVGVVLDAPEGITDIKPVGVSQAGGNSGGGGGAMAGAEGRNDGAPTERTLQQLTGDFGGALVTGFESRWMEGRLGTPFKNVQPATPATSTNSGMNSTGMMDPYAAGGMEGMDGGGAYAGPADAGGGADGGGTGPAAAASKPIIKGMVATPGMVYIGTGTQTELMQQTADQGYDGLFLFEIKVTHKRRGNLIENTTRLRFMGLDGKNVASTSPIGNIDIEKDQLRGIENNTLSKNIDRFFASFDEKVALVALPALKPEHAQDRIRQLLVDPAVNNLKKLFETRLYNSMNLLTDDEVAQVYQIILRGNDGLALASGTLADRRLVLDGVLAGLQKK